MKGGKKTHNNLRLLELLKDVFKKSKEAEEYSGSERSIRLVSSLLVLSLIGLREYKDASAAVTVTAF